MSRILALTASCTLSCAVCFVAGHVSGIRDSEAAQPVRVLSVEPYDDHGNRGMLVLFDDKHGVRYGALAKPVNTSLTNIFYTADDRASERSATADAEAAHRSDATRIAALEEQVEHLQQAVLAEDVLRRSKGDK